MIGAVSRNSGVIWIMDWRDTTTRTTPEMSTSVDLLLTGVINAFIRRRKVLGLSKPLTGYKAFEQMPMFVYVYNTAPPTIFY